MTTTITLVDEHYVSFYTQVSPDDSMLLTQMGRKRADSLVPATPASYQVNGPTGDGNVLYTAKYGGAAGCLLRIRHTVGGIGGGYESRPLQVSVIECDVTVQFGTDGGGVSAVPTSQEVEDAITASPEASALLEATAQGTGAGAVGVTDYEVLVGGVDDGDCLKFEGAPPTLRHVARIEVA